MKTLFAPFSSPRRHGPRSAFTLTETMVALAVFSLVVVGVIYSHLFGLRTFNITATKLSASQNARRTLNQLRDEIRSGKILYVGNGDNKSFAHVASNSPHQGNAVQIYPTADTNSFVRYYLDAAEQKLKRVASDSTNVAVIASYVTNQIAFRAEDYAGNALTNDQNNRVIKMSLEFYQWEFPLAQAGSGAFYDHYYLHTKITRRTIE